MVAMQARSLAQIGVGTLVLDLHGTGDSAGEFAEASWEIWLDDLQRGLAWLRTSGNGCRNLWGIRFGALLVGELARRDGQIERTLLWQPVLHGKSFYTQFLRIRIAAELNRPDRVKSTGELRQRSASGESIEVSGYRVGPALANALDQVVLTDPAALGAVQADWFEVLSSADTPATAASVKAIADFRAQGAQIRFETVTGPPFWQVHERELAPDLVAATTRCVDGWVPRVPSLAAAIEHATPVDDTAAEAPVSFGCGEDQLTGVLHRSAAGRQRGVVIVVAGGPQYRVGAHRQFVSLARKLSGRGFPVLRFDLRGMGDSSGTYVGFEHAEPDICAAIDELLARLPQLTEVVLLGECESASGILFYAWRDPRVTGAVLINPWVRTDEGRAQVIIKDYYLDRLRSPEFWNLVRKGEFKARESIVSMAGVVRAYFRGKKMMARTDAGAAQDDISGLPLPVRTAVGLRRFRGKALLLMSGHDYIAREFDEVTRASKAWDGLLEDERITRCEIEGADHTFSKDVWKTAASDAVVDWLERG